MLNRTWLLILGNLLIALILICLIELASFLILLRHDNPDIPFLVNLNHAPAWPFDDDFKGEIRGNQQIDALTGWSDTEDDLRKKGHTVEHGIIVLKSTADTCADLNILITGGSTSDLNYRAYNWPALFTSLLHDNHVNAKVYVAAVVGYHSGQELLKLIRDGLETQPTIHISYSGANEGSNPAYVTVYEQNFFINGFVKRHSILMPNTIFLLQKLFHMNQYNVSLIPRKKISPEIFWQRNMKIMHGIAYSYNYYFVGILQPVVGSGNYTQPVPEEFTSNVEVCRKFYPAAREIVKEADYLADLSLIFDTAKSGVYVDHCHVDSTHQGTIARAIYEILERRNLLAPR